MRTYTAPGGTVFHVNSDGSGDAIVCTRNGALRWAEGVRAEVPASDLLAFADWLRERRISSAHPIGYVDLSGLELHRIETWDGHEWKTVPIADAARTPVYTSRGVRAVTSETGAAEAPTVTVETGWHEPKDSED